MAFETTKEQRAQWRGLMAPHWNRFVRAVTFRPLVINTADEWGNPPEADRLDWFGKAYVNLIVEACKLERDMDRGGYISGHYLAWALLGLFVWALAATAAAVI